MLEGWRALFNGPLPDFYRYNAVTEEYKEYFSDYLDWCGAQAAILSQVILQVRNFPCGCGHPPPYHCIWCCLELTPEQFAEARQRTASTLVDRQDSRIRSRH
jgi:hypothetical protein